MLVGHAGDVENDAGDVDELVKCVNFARKCCKIRHFAGPDEKRKKSPKKKRKKKPKINPHPHLFLFFKVLFGGIILYVYCRFRQ